MLTKPRTVCVCQLVAAMISARVTPFGRCVVAITSAFLLVLDSSAALRAGARFLGLGRSLLLLLGGRDRHRLWRSGGDRHATASQMRWTATLRFVDFFTGFRSSKGAAPAKLFHTSNQAGGRPLGDEFCQFVFGGEDLLVVGVVKRRRDLSMLSEHHVRNAYQEAYERCRMQGALPRARAIQELVTVWKLLWSWKRKTARSVDAMAGGGRPDA